MWVLVSALTGHTSGLVAWVVRTQALGRERPTRRRRKRPSEQTLHDRDVEPTVELAADLPFDADEFEATLDM